MCTPCDPGTFSDTSGSTDCTACTPGTYQPLNSSSTCLNCDPGTYAAGTGSILCDTCTPTCPAGQYQSAACTATSDTGCAACDASCSTCSGGTAADCTTCPTGDAPVSGVCPAGCTLAPTSPCRAPVISAKAKLDIKDNALDDTKDRLKWKWVKGAETQLEEFGDPTTTDGYFLCVYDNGTRLSTMALPAGGVCKTKPCWKAKSTGFSYKDPELTPNGVLSATLKAGAEEKASVKVSAKGSNLPTPDPSAFTGPVVVQLQRADHMLCFEATYSAPFTKNLDGKFSDKAD